MRDDNVIVAGGLFPGQARTPEKPPLANGHDAEAPQKADIDLNSEIEKLSQLSGIEYQSVRKAEGKRLGLLLSALDAAVKSARKKRASEEHGGRPKKSDEDLFDADGFMINDKKKRIGNEHNTLLAFDMMGVELRYSDFSHRVFTRISRLRPGDYRWRIQQPVARTAARLPLQDIEGRSPRHPGGGSATTSLSPG